SSPALAVHQDKLYMAWRGAGKGHDKIYYASFDGKNWSHQNRAANFVITKNSSPALAIYQDKLYLTWRGADEGIYYASFESTNWSHQNRAGTFGISQDSSPALAVHQDKLYMAWRGAGDGHDKIYYANFDVTNWSMQKRVPNFKTLVDGGIFINNPAMDLFLRAKSKNDAKQFVLVSLGTGNFIESHPELKNAGFLGWIRPLISYIMKGVSITVDDHLKKIIGNSSESIKSGLINESFYYRFEPDFDENIAMDAIDKQDIQRLQELGNKLVEYNKSELDRLVNQLKSYL
ncbi:hypothetical protein, partial [Coleofasciculus sp.]|uniref:hypothetical protein n=1 Tax=Coleofasciculus sp. TaxID=3100458 RepID=UPI003A419481